MSDNILRDVASRTKGEVYIGVVGSVRSGKSTFIRKFMEKKVLPILNDQYTYEKIQDELPQSGEGKVITTVEPKFVPSNNVKITIDNDISFQVRLVDCVGYIIPSAKGYLNEDGSNRLVQTPWFSDAIPFEDAAKLGTEKVIESHSNIGIVMSSDGSFGDFTREEYEKVEEQVIEELQKLNKPFILIINTTKPNAVETTDLVATLSEKYGVGVIALDVLHMEEPDIDKLMKLAIDEFDIGELNLDVPSWVDVLDDSISYKQQFNILVNQTTGTFRKMKDAFRIQDTLKESNLFTEVAISNIDSGTGIVEMNINCSDEIYNSVITEILGEEITDKGVFVKTIQKLKKSESVYELVAPAIVKVNQLGYGLALPKVEQMELSNPELLKEGSRYGIKIKASAPMLQLVKINVDSSFEPIIGSKEQAEELLTHMQEDFENNPEKLWSSEIFGRKLCDVISDGIRSKMNAVPDQVLEKFKSTMEKIVNYGKGGLIAIVL